MDKQIYLVYALGYDLHDDVRMVLSGPPNLDRIVLEYCENNPHIKQRWNEYAEDCRAGCKIGDMILHKPKEPEMSLEELAMRWYGDLIIPWLIEHKGFKRIDYETVCIPDRD